MDEFGAPFGRVSEFTNRKRMDAPAAPASRFQYCHLPARTPEFAGGHQTCGTRADHDDMVWMVTNHALPIDHPGILILDPVPQQQCAAIQSLAAVERHRRDGGAVIGLRVRGIEDARCTLCPVHSRTED